MPINERHVLLTSQRNQLFTAIQSKGFKPEEFNFYEEDNSAHLNSSTQYGCRISVGSFTVTGSMGALETYTVPYRLVSSPGSELIQEERYFGSWNNVIDGFNKWLTRLTAELQIPDLWTTVSGDTHLIRLASNQDNRPFTPDEQLQFKKTLDEIKAFLIKSHTLSGARLAAVESRLSYVEEAVTRMGPKDVIHITIGVLANIATGLALDASSTRELFQFAGQIFKRFLGTLLYLAGPH